MLGLGKEKGRTRAVFGEGERKDMIMVGGIRKERQELCLGKEKGRIGTGLVE